MEEGSDEWTEKQVRVDACAWTDPYPIDTVTKKNKFRGQSSMRRVDITAHRSLWIKTPDNYRMAGINKTELISMSASLSCPWQWALLHPWHRNMKSREDHPPVWQWPNDVQIENNVAQSATITSPGKPYRFYEAEETNGKSQYLDILIIEIVRQKDNLLTNGWNFEQLLSQVLQILDRHGPENVALDWILDRATDTILGD